ncbi:non-ribosomal peptide synthetase family protein [Paenibacillus dauci]|uniref:non-ribosomal peptide synthetase family protein n=2 Tax=Paenibacillus TaxID=44249 RepID=UPI00061A075D|nr:non-ribosomal peptide synthetase [Paenibacillus dauci]
MSGSDKTVEVLENEASHKDYWKKRLAHIESATGFLYDYDSFDQESQRSEYRMYWSEDSQNKINRLTNKSPYKLHMIAISIVKVLLYKYTGVQDLVIGTPIYKQTEVKRMLNRFLPIRGTAAGDTLFKELILQTREALLEANTHQNAPVESIMHRLYPQSDLASIPMVDVMVAVDQIQSLEDNSQLDFACIFVFSEETVKINYDSRLYDAYTIQNIANSLEYVLNMAVSCPETPIKSLQLVPYDSGSIIHNQNNKETEVMPLHCHLESQAAVTPDQTAIISGSHSITYKELHVYANRVARRIRKLTSPNDKVIGIMMEPSIQLAVGLLAILKAGKAYVPIDPRYPQHRLEHIMEDSEIRLVLTQDLYMFRFENKVHMLNMDDEPLDEEDGSNLTNTAVCSDDLAYLIYTSGSTGTPKGVMIEQQTIVKTMLWRQKEYGFNSEHTVLQLVSFAFDGFIGGFFAPLMSGSTIILPQSDHLKNVHELQRIIRENSITHLHSVPALAQLIIESMDKLGAAALQAITVGGDITPAELIEQCMQLNIELINEYGPTENTIVTSILRNMEIQDRSCIGRPVADTVIYITDQDGNLCPPGVKGELWIGGGRLARGYWRNDALTAEKFIRDPFTGTGRVYKTGDVVRLRKDGKLNFLGRSDSQVKINGFRIETGEIERRLESFKVIKQAVVKIVEQADDTKSLCAYYTAHQPIQESEVHHYLSVYVPDYMIPRYFVLLNEFPLTVNGKIDRNILPLPQAANSMNNKYVPPTTPVEIQIERVWCKVLNKEQIGIYDDFFGLGGDSLKAIRTAGHLAEYFTIAINDVYEHPTINELALHLTQITNKEWTSNTLDQTVKDVQEYGHLHTATAGSQIHQAENDYIAKSHSYAASISLDTEKHYKNILITGATGYVGIYLLRQLLQSTSSTIYVLVRGKTKEQSVGRLSEVWQFYFKQAFEEEIWRQRVIVIAGDVSQPFFDLSEVVYNELAHKCDCIIHSAALVKHYGHYQEFYNTNILGTRHIIDFAQLGIKKDINHMSTTTVADGNIQGTDRILYTEYDMDQGQKSNNYYSQTKLEAEKMVWNASQNDPSLCVKIFRLGNVSFEYDTGHFQKNIDDNAVCNMLKSYMLLKAFPELPEPVLNFSYVDQLADSIIMLFNREALRNEVFHMYNPYQLSIKEIGNMFQQLDHTIQIKNMDEFLLDVSSYVKNNENSHQLDRLLTDIHTHSIEDTTEFVLKNNKTIMLLQRMGFDWHKMNQKAVKKMVDYWKKEGFIQ